MATRPGLEEAVARVGDRWTLLLVDALLGGARTFSELQRDLPGVAPNILSKRLKHLEAEHLLVATPYTDRPPRFRYQLTASGEDLAGALRLLAQWGERSGDGDPLHHDACGTALEARWFCPTCSREVGPDEADDLRYA